MDGSYRARADARRKVMVARVARSPREREDLEFERESAVEPFRRAEAIWTLVCDLTSLRGDDGSKLRLDRSLARIERRGR
jgi:hypothetical protein